MELILPPSYSFMACAATYPKWRMGCKKERNDVYFGFRTTKQQVVKVMESVHKILCAVDETRFAICRYENRKRSYILLLVFCLVDVHIATSTSHAVPNVRSITPWRLVLPRLSYHGPSLTRGVFINYLISHKALWD